MSIRDDLEVDWDVSPRIITVLSPSVFIGIQDLHDTCRHLESQFNAMNYDALIDSAGKEPLGGGVLVGLTATLQNAKLAFEARPGPTFVQCRVSGGNLVAVDENGDDLFPVEVTAYTQVMTTSSSSATLLEAEVMEQLSYGGSVFIDVLYGVSGDHYPIGTRLYPVKNLDQAIEIAELYGLNYIHIIGSLEITGAKDVSGFTFKADRSISNFLKLTSAVTEGTFFQDLTVDGTLNGRVRFTTCVLAGLTGFNGGAKNSLLTGNITFVGTALNYLTDCDCFTTTLDDGFKNLTIGACLVNLIRCQGGYHIAGKTGDNLTLVSLTSGVVRVDSTDTEGIIRVTGIGTLKGETGGTEIDQGDLVSPAEITEQVWESVEAQLLLDLAAKQEDYVHNKNALVKVGSTWHFRIYAANGIDIILDKEEKDKDGNDITDVAAGVMALELMSTV